MAAMRLWYKKPAERWETALPIGNGRMGAMVHGRTEVEDVQLNEDSVWHGRPIDRINPDALPNLSRIRELIREGRIREAEDLALSALSGTPESQRPYQPLGNLYVDFARRAEGRDRAGADHGREPADYLRALDLDTAIASVSYATGGNYYERECFMSYPDQVLAMRIVSRGKGGLGFSACLRRGLFMDESIRIAADAIMMTGSGGEGGVAFCVMAKAIACGGSARAIGDDLIVEGADSAVILVSAATSFREGSAYREACARTLDAAALSGYEAIKARHLADYRKFSSRVSLDLGGGDDGLDALPTDERRERMKRGEDDEGLIALYFQYGRYLLLSSSRPGSLPANLQGVWNKEMSPPWGCKYTININAQMNYWPAEPCNLPECHEPLFELIARMRESGRDTARRMYGCRGFVAHHNTDLWADTAPQDRWIPGTYWPMGAAWLCLHVWEHYRFSLDQAFLAERYPLMREAAEFFIDFLVDDGTGKLVTSPSVSPENTYIHESGERGSLCAGPSMDSQIIASLMKACLEAERVLGLASESASKFGEILGKLHAPRIGKEGTILEWAREYGEAEPGHRHISHLFALHPGDMITVDGTPELAAAASRTLERRLAHGGGHTGWSRAWIVNLYARLRKGDVARAHLAELLRRSTLPNLFDDHPPFQIDGNFGGTAAIAEMLVQSHEWAIRLLPALPSSWRKGAVSGLRCRGGAEVSIRWEDGRLERAEFLPIRDGEETVAYGTAARKLALRKGERTAIDRAFFA